VLPDEDQRDLYDAFHLQVRYDRVNHQVALQVTVFAEVVPALIGAVQAFADNDALRSRAAGAAERQPFPIWSVPPVGVEPTLAEV
jgi:hypothetical protein